MKKNKFNYEGTIKAVEMLFPEELKDEMKNTIETCKNEGILTVSI